MRLRPRRRNLVIWSPSACRAERGRGLWFSRPARPRRIRRRIRTLALFAGMLFLLSALLTPADPVVAGPRRRELERELAAYSTPDQRCDLEATFDRYPDSATGELRDILARQAAAAGTRSAVSSPFG